MTTGSDTEMNRTRPLAETELRWSLTAIRSKGGQGCVIPKGRA